MIGVLAGGDSPERAVSLVSGENVHRTLIDLDLEARLIQTESLDDLFPSLEGIDVVFSCLHGGSGEDGTVQAFLDVMGVPYAGSGALACARAMDKMAAKRLFELARVPTPPGVALGRNGTAALVKEVQGSFDAPYVVKPVDSGSTLGVELVEQVEDLETTASRVAAKHGSVLVEPFIAGRELTVGILHQEDADRPLPVIEIRFPSALFDYEAKYTDGVADFVAPADLPEETAREVQAVAVRAHEALGCSGFSRVDLRFSEDGIPYVLEVNALPGMTPISDLPRAAAVAGIPYERLVELMLESATKEAA